MDSGHHQRLSSEEFGCSPDRIWLTLPQSFLNPCSFSSFLTRPMWLQQSHKPQYWANSKLRPTHRLTAVEFRPTSVQHTEKWYFLIWSEIWLLPFILSRVHHLKSSLTKALCLPGPRAAQSFYWLVHISKLWVWESHFKAYIHWYWLFGNGQFSVR